MICLVCPKSCLLTEDISCKKGLEFAKKEMTDPERILTSSMKVEFGELPLVSVRSDKTVKKAELKTLIKQLDEITVPAPVLNGQILISGLGKNNVNIIATRTVGKQE